MVLALEPGFYLPGRFGVRKEKLFLVTLDGAVELAETMRRALSDRAIRVEFIAGCTSQPSTADQY